MPVRAKFKVERNDACAIDKLNYQTGEWEAYEAREITFAPVFFGSPENDDFFIASPGGHIDLNYADPAASAQFEVGKEFFVDFTPAD